MPSVPYGKKSCQTCWKRERDAGGAGSCPLLRIAQRKPLKTTGAQPVLSRLAPGEYQARWAAGEGPNPPGHDCSSWKSGDPKVKLREPEPTEALF